MGPPSPRDTWSTEEDGRGLLLVEALADAWGTRPTASGKTVWFTLLLTPSADRGAERASLTSAPG